MNKFISIVCFVFVSLFMFGCASTTYSKEIATPTGTIKEDRTKTAWGDHTSIKVDQTKEYRDCLARQSDLGDPTAHDKCVMVSHQGLAAQGYGHGVVSGGSDVPRIVGAYQVQSVFLPMQVQQQYAPSSSGHPDEDKVDAALEGIQENWDVTRKLEKRVRRLEGKKK
jgi:hypothetical protein